MFCGFLIKRRARNVQGFEITCLEFGSRNSRSMLISFRPSLRVAILITCSSAQAKTQESRKEFISLSLHLEQNSRSFYKISMLVVIAFLPHISNDAFVNLFLWAWHREGYPNGFLRLCGVCAQSPKGCSSPGRFRRLCRIWTHQGWLGRRPGQFSEPNSKYNTLTRNPL